MLIKFLSLYNKPNPISYYLVVGLVIKLLNALIFSLCLYNHPELMSNPIDDEAVDYQIFLGVFLGPIFETYLFQVLIINFADNFLSKNAKAQSLIVISLSATIFAAVHYFSWAYQLAMIIPGFIFAYGYWFFRQQKSQAVAFWVVCVLHMLYNLIVTILELLLNI